MENVISNLVRRYEFGTVGLPAYLVMGALLVSSVAQAQSANSPTFHINSQRLQGTLVKLSEFGRNPEGGVTRLGFSETDLAARQYVAGLMKQAGLEVRVDPAGNIFGLRAGSEKLPTLLFGSHIDSVLHGGNFDGDVGNMGAIEVMRALKDGSVKTRHPLEAVIWTNEEGNHFGIGTLGSGVAAQVRPPSLPIPFANCPLVQDWLALAKFAHVQPPPVCSGTWPLEQLCGNE